MIFFFFSSRRRHTRFDCDWSSDVCSSDLNALNAGYGDDISGDDSLGFIAVEAAEGVELCDFGRGELAVELADADLFATIQRAVKHAADRQTAKKFGVVAVRDLKLQDAGGIACRSRDFADDCFEERKQVLRIVADLAMRYPGACVGVNNGEVEL